MEYRGVKYSLNDCGYVTTEGHKKFCREFYFFSEEQFKHCVDVQMKRDEEA